MNGAPREHRGRRGPWREIAWFAALWLAGTATLAAVGLMLRAALGA